MRPTTARRTYTPRVDRQAGTRGSEPAPEGMEEYGRGRTRQDVLFFPLFCSLSLFAFSSGYGEKESLGHPHYDGLTVWGYEMGIPVKARRCL